MSIKTRFEAIYIGRIFRLRSGVLSPIENINNILMWKVLWGEFNEVPMSERERDRDMGGGVRKRLWPNKCSMATMAIINF